MADEMKSANKQRGLSAKKNKKTHFGAELFFIASTTF